MTSDFNTQLDNKNCMIKIITKEYGIEGDTTDAVRPTI